MIINFPNNIEFYTLETVSVSDEMPGLHCFQKYPFTCLQNVTEKI